MEDRITPAQLRGARAMLGWSLVDLARAADLSISTVRRMERRDAIAVPGVARTAACAALERAGVALLDDDGVVLRKVYPGERL